MNVKRSHIFGRLWGVADSSVPEMGFLATWWRNWSTLSHHDTSNNMQDSGTDESATPQSLYRKYGYVCHPLANTATLWQKKFINKTRRLLKVPCKFILLWKTTQVNCFLSYNDKTPSEYRSSVVYQFSCPGCRSSYIGKTDRCLFTQLKEHNNRDHESSEINAHINSWREHFQHINTLTKLTPDSTQTINTNTTVFTLLIFDNCKIIDISDNWSLYYMKNPLQFAEENQNLTTAARLQKNWSYFNDTIKHL